jgi:hypothetical protein
MEHVQQIKINTSIYIPGISIHVISIQILVISTCEGHLEEHTINTIRETLESKSGMLL